MKALDVIYGTATLPYWAVDTPPPYASLPGAQAGDIVVTIGADIANRGLSPQDYTLYFEHVISLNDNIKLTGSLKGNYDVVLYRVIGELV